MGAYVETSETACAQLGAAAVRACELPRERELLRRGAADPAEVTRPHAVRGGVQKRACLSGAAL
eukprot:4100301-Prymnesium_polylepis.3